MNAFLLHRVWWTSSLCQSQTALNRQSADMSWIWEKSSTWRWLVATTKRSPGAMAVFTIGMCVVPYYAGKVVMAGTNMRAEQGTSLEQQLRARQTLEHKVGRLTVALLVKDA